MMFPGRWTKGACCSDLNWLLTPLSCLDGREGGGDCCRLASPHIHTHAYPGLSHSPHAPPIWPGSHLRLQKTQKESILSIYHTSIHIVSGTEPVLLCVIRLEWLQWIILEGVFDQADNTSEPPLTSGACVFTGLKCYIVVTMWLLQAVVNGCDNRDTGPDRFMAYRDLYASNLNVLVFCSHDNFF